MYVNIYYIGWFVLADRFITLIISELERHMNMWFLQECLVQKGTLCSGMDYFMEILSILEGQH